LGADLALVLGGDGTLNEAANGLVKSGVALGVLPAGTANVLGMELGLGSRLPLALERLMSYEPRQIALGCLSTAREKRYFLCMAGLGLDAKIVTKVDPALKDRTGKLAYWAAGLSQVPERLEAFEICVNGQVYQCGFALVSRVRNYGGDLEIASGASLKRDDFEVVLFEGTHPLRYIGYMVGVGLKQVQRMPGVRTLRAETVEIMTSTHLQIDGEYAGFGRGRLEIEPGALTLLMPSTN
jgi:diacylglycerol kinase (ATP)